MDDETLGNGIQTIRNHDLVTGSLNYILSGPSSNGTIQDLSYAWDTVGNLTQRQDIRQSLTESFYYDNLHRLSSTTGPDPITLTYDSMGNISSKTGVGSYTYHATRKHAVTAAGGNTYAYDANGNASSRNGNSISWYSYNLPNVISGPSSNSSQFFYAPDRSRWKQVASYGGTSEQTIYVGNLIEKVTLGGVTSWKHYIAGGSGPAAVYTRKSSGTNEIHYLTRDHLGSVDSVTNAAGSIEVRLSFGSFGQRRNEDTWTGNPTAGDWTQITNTSRRGFTTHEMLDNLNLTHMNGRVYDQVVGRFLSADPIVQGPELTQSFNRYSYTLNNPLKFTDPSGFQRAVGRLRFNRDRGEGSSDEISSAAEMAFVNGNRSFHRTFGNGSINGIPAMQTMTGAQWAQRTVLNGHRGVRGAAGAGTFVGRARWVSGGTVGVGAVGADGQAVNANPAVVRGHWEVGDGSSTVGGTGNQLSRADVFSSLGDRLSYIRRHLIDATFGLSIGGSLIVGPYGRDFRIGAYGSCCESPDLGIAFTIGKPSEYAPNLSISTSASLGAIAQLELYNIGFDRLRGTGSAINLVTPIVSGSANYSGSFEGDPIGYGVGRGLGWGVSATDTTTYGYGVRDALMQLFDRLGL